MNVNSSPFIISSLLNLSFLFLFFESLCYFSFYFFTKLIFILETLIFFIFNSDWMKFYLEFFCMNSYSIFLIYIIYGFINFIGFFIFISIFEKVIFVKSMWIIFLKLNSLLSFILWYFIGKLSSIISFVEML